MQIRFCFSAFLWYWRYYQNSLCIQCIVGNQSLVLIIMFLILCQLDHIYFLMITTWYNYNPVNTYIVVLLKGVSFLFIFLQQFANFLFNLKFIFYLPHHSLGEMCHYCKNIKKKWIWAIFISNTFHSSVNQKWRRMKEKYTTSCVIQKKNFTSSN